MGITGMEAAGAASASDNSMDRSPRARLRGWLRVPGAEDGSESAERLAELEREIALLREENARLKMAREHAGDRSVNERVRAAFRARGGEDEADGEDPWEVLTECMLLRETMLDACRELEGGAAELRTRLETLLADEGAERLRSDLEGVA
jgi:uncharacterized small protein (DUF1192 family)